ncbi:hypothetical protein A3B57_03560 [Microgenomates group bacterium RIFCSPLOWO2_01_FULL_47_10]|nr:MAG: hypothetical protein A3B57_03560 [Microgenomates group bacterium RIFCSPLOWO2_01_FULL_47_10]
MFIPYLAISLAIIGVDFLGWFAGIHTVGEKGINGLSFTMTKIGKTAIRPFSNIAFMVSGPERIADLESRYAESLVKAERTVQLKAENDSLRKLLGSGALTQYRYDPVKVVSLHGGVVLAGGMAMGLSAGSNVVDENNVLIGRVTRVSQWTSWVTPVIDPLSSIPVVVGSSLVAGILKGEGTMAVMAVEQADSVSVGDRVESSGITGDFVAGLLIGRVVEVEPETANIYKQVKVEPLASPGEFVYIVGEKNK